MPPRELRKTATLLTMPSPSNPTFSLSSHDLLNAFGLQEIEYRRHTSTASDDLTWFSLGDGRWDERTGGAVAVKTRFALDAEKRLRSLETLYLAVQPDGRFSTSKLFELDTRASGAKLRLSRLHILGRAVDIEQGDRIARVTGALKRIHADIRNLKFPEVAKILNDFQIAQMTGYPLDLPGLSIEGGFNFQVPPPSAQNKSTLFVLPRNFMPELLGTGTNDIDSTHAFDRHNSQIGSHQEGGLFRYSAALKTGKNVGALKAETLPLHRANGNAIPDLVDVSWRAEDDKVIVERFVLLGEESSHLSSGQRQKRLGVVNLDMKDLRLGSYPATPDHAAHYNQNDLIDNRTVTSALDHHKQMYVIPLGGHNDREYLPGFGGTIGGNSKFVFSAWRDAADHMRRKGVLIDYGIVFNKKNGIQAGEHGHFDYALPDVSKFHNDFEDILITHLHADHMQGIVDLSLAGMAAPKTVHASVYDWRVLEQFLKKAKVPKNLWPQKDALDGEGWIHIDDGTERVMSVYYSTNAIPHSTNVTAFLITPQPYLCDFTGHAFPGKPEINPHYWSYASLGDMSFGPYNLPDYQGPKPPDTGFKHDLFAKFKSGMRCEYPDLPGRMKKTVDAISVAECDPTSIHRDGFAPNVLTAEGNWCRFSNWFGDKGIWVPNLSTAKRAHEMMMRVANRTQRHITAEGAYIEDRFTDMNVMGVNTDVLPKQDRGNIQAYLDLHAKNIGGRSVEYHDRTSGKWHEIISESPHQTLILATGSQGSEIEKDAVGTQIANGWSRLQLDRKYCRAAYGVDPQDFVFVYAQGAIPGHEDEQLAQIRKTAFENDLTVAAAVHNGTRFYNLKEPYLSRIAADLESTGERYTREPSGGLFIHGFSIYVPGHGWKEDYRQGFFPFFKENNVQSIWVQHFDRQESVRIAYDLADEIDLGHPRDSIPNLAVCTMAGGKEFKIVARETPSFILARTNRRADKYHGGTTEYKRAVFRTGENGMADNGLFTANANTIYFQDYGIADYEQTKRETMLPPLRSRREPDKAMTREPPQLGLSEFQPTRGIASPLPLRHHLHLGLPESKVA